MRRLKRKQTEGFVWISFSDLLTALLLAFIVITVSSILQAKDQNSHMAEGHECLQREEKNTAGSRARAAGLKSLSESLLQKIVLLQKERDICRQAGVEVNSEGDGIRMFVSRPEDESAWFQDSGNTLGVAAQECLAEFSSLWIQTIEDLKLKDEVEHLLIEGHSNSKPYAGTKNESENFLYNLELSQKRALMAAKYMLETDSELAQWKRETFIAVGKSFLEPIPSKAHEDMIKSKRLEFRVKLKPLNIEREAKTK